MTKKRLFGCIEDMNQLLLLSIMVRYGILVFAAVSRRDLRERVAQPGPSRDTAPVGLRRTGCTALPRLFQANGMNSVLRSTYPPYAIFGPRLNNHGFAPHAAFGAGKTGRFLQKESPRPSGFGPARCGPGISIMCLKVMYGSKLTGRQCVEGPPSIYRVTGRERRRTPQLIFRQFAAPGIS